jgi:nucleoside-diphosphate-sugar epimerase|tara:strand:- start:2196 stop:3170 length:975 start_codon:yes stop_codon:yes gene_type:complete
MKNRHVLVTGGTGFIGAALATALTERGYQVRVFDNDFRGDRNRLKKLMDDVDIVTGDIRDESAVLDAAEGVDIIYHLAAINGTRYFYEIPDQVLDVNVRGALNTLKACLVHNVNRFVLASSSEVYQTPLRIPTDESERIYLEDVTNPRYSYAGSKLISELLTLNCLRSKATHGIIFRPHNIYGPDMGNEHVIPELMRKIHLASKRFKKNKIRVTIQGSGNETRAFCFIDNAVDAILICGEKGGNGEIYHIGEMREIRIGDLVKMLGDILSMKIEVIPGTALAGGTPRRCPDIGKISKLGYKPLVSLEEGLETTIAWYVRRLSGK